MLLGGVTRHRSAWGVAWRLLALAPLLGACARQSTMMRDPATGQTTECRNAVNPAYPAARVIFGSQEVDQCVAEHRAAGWQPVR